MRSRDRAIRLLVRLGLGAGILVVIGGALSVASPAVGGLIAAVGGLVLFLAPISAAVLGSHRQLRQNRRTLDERSGIPKDPSPYWDFGFILSILTDRKPRSGGRESERTRDDDKREPREPS